MAEDISIFQEIDESLRVEKLQQFWQRFGNWVIGGCVGIVLLTIASVLWKSHIHDMNMKSTSLLIRAMQLQQAGKADDATVQLEDATKGKGGVATLAKLNLAQQSLKAGELDKALALYNEVVADRHSDEALRDLAALQATTIADNLHSVLPATHADKNGRPFSVILREIEAAKLLKDGKTSEAQALLKPIAEDNTATFSERARAMEMLDTINGSNP
jgi:hypothetical protein